MTLELINGKIYTLDHKNSIHEALVIEKNIITKVGTTQEIRDSDVDKHVDQVVDLQKKVVLPGFIDAHTHLGHMALESLWIDLSKIESKGQILKLVKDRSRDTPIGNWVVGVGYDDATWEDEERLSKVELDAISTDHPIFVRRVCGHYGVVNSIALKYIDEGWKYVDRQTGILVEDAVLGFMKIIKPDISKRLSGTQKLFPEVYSLGLTAVREIVNLQSIKIYHSLDKEKQLKLRVYGYIIIDDLDEYLNKYPEGIIKTARFNLIGVKILLDGSLGARTAALQEPYNDAPGNYGKLLYSESELTTIFKRIKELGYPMMIHAIGDRATLQFVDVYKKVFSEQIPDNPLGHSLEHVEVIDNNLLSILKSLGIYASLQPNFAGRWSAHGGLNERRLGSERLTKCNAYKDFLKKGISIVFGSDSMPLDPLFGINSAIYHPVRDQRLQPFDAVKAYVQNCYEILGLDSKFGSLVPGKVADLVILTGDPFQEQNLDEIEVAGTIIDGELVYSKGLAALRC